MPFQIQLLYPSYLCLFLQRQGQGKAKLFLQYFILFIQYFILFILNENEKVFFTAAQPVMSASSNQLIKNPIVTLQV